MLHALGISLASFRIAGGIMLFFIALDMVFERRTERREKRAEAIEGTPEAEDISVFPMAIPMIAGPGLDRQRDAVGVARRNAGRMSPSCWRAITVVMLLTLIDLARRRAADAADRREDRSDDHPHPRRDPRGACRPVRDRRFEAELPARPRLRPSRPPSTS